MIRVLLGLPQPLLKRRLERLMAAPDVGVTRLAAKESLWSRLTRDDFDVVVLSGATLQGGPKSLIASIRELPDRPEVIVMVRDQDELARARLESASCLAVLWEGLPDEQLQGTLESVLGRLKEERPSQIRAGRLTDQPSLSDFVSNSPTMQRFLGTVRQLTRVDSALLLQGETGVGKERLARGIHYESLRARGPFLAVNCGALPETLLESELFGHEEGAFTGASRPRRGYFELAHNGTLFLDEIGEIPLHLQVKLLRVLEERCVRRLGSERAIPINTRIMAATNRSLAEEVKAKRFRADLFYRLAVVTVDVPPLRDRRQDIPDLVRSYLLHFRSVMGKPITDVDADAMEALVGYDWPGNVRELINVIERAIILCPGHEIGISELPVTVTGGAAQALDRQLELAVVTEPPADDHARLLDKPFRKARAELLASFERAYVKALLKESGGRISEAARRADIDARSLFNLMRRHALRKEDFKPPSPARSRTGQRTAKS